MTVADLQGLAAFKGINVDGMAKNQIIEAIQAAE